MTIFNFFSLSVFLYTFSWFSTENNAKIWFTILEQQRSRINSRNFYFNFLLMLLISFSCKTVMENAWNTFFCYNNIKQRMNEWSFSPHLIFTPKKLKNNKFLHYSHLFAFTFLSNLVKEIDLDIKFIFFYL